MPTLTANSRRDDRQKPDPARVSVILPTYNRAEYLASSIQSILDQTAPLREIVVVDDGSQDETGDVVAAFGDRVTYLRQDNAGKLAAIGRGLDRIKGELVWIMDDDDLADPRAVEMLLEPFDRNADQVMTYGRMTQFDDGSEGRDDDTPVPYPVGDDRPFFVQLMEDCFVTGHPCVLVKRAALEAMRPFRTDVMASVDYYLHLGMAQQGRTSFVDHLVLRQRQHGGPRGPAAIQYAATERTQKWIAFDRRLIGALIDGLPLGAYIHAPEEPGFGEHVADPKDRRRALFQKGAIAARKKLWAEALDAFRNAVDIAPQTQLEPGELHILTRALGCRYGIDEVHGDPDIPFELARIAAKHSQSTAFLVAVSRPLLHEGKIAYRERDGSLARDAARTWFRLMTWRANAAALAAVLRRNGRRLGPSP